MRTITKVLLGIALFLSGFNLSRCDDDGGGMAMASAPQPRPTAPLADYQLGLESSVLVEMEDGNCTGVIESDYILVTATHCLEGGSTITATTTYANGQYLRYENSGRIIANDGNDNVKVRMTHRLYGRHAKLAKMPPPGTEVYVWGNPGGFQFLLRKGYVAGKVASDEGTVFDVLDLGVWHGDSGGAIYDSQGNVVGLVHAYWATRNPMNGVQWKMAITQPFAFSSERLQ